MTDHKPVRQLNVLMGNDEHKSCWDCTHIRVSVFPFRWCHKYADQHIWAGDAEYEMMENGKTVADHCSSYELDEFHVSKGVIVGD